MRACNLAKVIGSPIEPRQPLHTLERLVIRRQATTVRTTRGQAARTAVRNSSTTIFNLSLSLERSCAADRT
jgi:hypothetical protein